MTTPKQTEPHNFENLPEALVAALGKLTLRFGQVEHILAAIIHRTTQEPWDEVLKRLGTDLKPRRELLSEARRCWVDWASSTFNDMEADERKRKFDRVRNKLGVAMERRDELTHCAWGIDKDGYIRATRRGGPFLINDRPAGQDHIEATAQELWCCFRILNEISRQPETVRSYVTISPRGPVANVIPIDPTMTVTATGASYGDLGAIKVIGKSENDS